MVSHNQFTAPDGLATMVKGEVHHLLRSDYARERVILVVFTPGRRSRLVIVGRDRFEQSLVEAAVCRHENAETLPPWLLVHGSLERVTQTMHDPNLRADPESDASVGARLAEERLNHIQDAVLSVADVLSAPDPNKVLNQYARACEPPQNESRFRTWFYAYLVFGRNIAALYPAFHNRGRYDRGDAKYTAPSGAPGAAGAHFRSKMTTTEEAKKILEAFDRHAKLLRTRDEVYDKALRKSYGCSVEDIEGKAHYFHPEGKPFPTAHQFWYRCELERGGRLGIKKILRGEETVRNKDLLSRGQYSEGSGNIFEHVHLDVEHSEEKPLPYVGTTPKPSISICIVRDRLTGMGLGIGGGNGVEDARIYLEALFCMAIPKSLFGRLIGYPINDADWPCVGLPTWATTDRGPGGHQALLQRIQEMGIARTLTPTRSPQSNSTSEGRNSRRAKIAGIPVEEIGTLTTIRLFQKMVELLIKANRSSRAVDRAGNGQIMQAKVTPLELHMDMERRARTDAQPVSVEEAVRMFLQPIELKHRDGRLYLKELPFGGLAWQRFLERFPAGPRRANLKGYCLTLSTRHIWVEVEGELLMVDALNRYRDGDHDLFLSFDELAEVGRTRAQAETARRNRLPAERGLAEIKFEERTGQSMDVRPVRSTSRSKTSHKESEMLKP